MKKFEPHYRLVRVGLAKKIEKASRQQRTYTPDLVYISYGTRNWVTDGHKAGGRAMSMAGMDRYADSDFTHNRQAAQEPTEDPARHSEGQGCQGQEGEISDSPPSLRSRIVDPAVLPPASRPFGSTSVFRVGFWSGIARATLALVGRDLSIQGGKQRGREGTHTKDAPYLMILQFSTIEMTRYT